VVVVVIIVCRDYLTGFRKRKNKRRKVAAQQNDIKERQRRLQERKEVSDGCILLSFCSMCNRRAMCS
jgi:hypothetical protein